MLIRAFEEALASRKDHGFQLLSSGEEAVAVGLCSAFNDDDQLLTGGRSIGPALARGLEPNRVMAELSASRSGTNRGKGGRGHLADPSAEFFWCPRRRGRQHQHCGGCRIVQADVRLQRNRRLICSVRRSLRRGCPSRDPEHCSELAASDYCSCATTTSCRCPRPAPRRSRQKNCRILAWPSGCRLRPSIGMNVDVVAHAAREAVEHVREWPWPSLY